MENTETPCMISEPKTLDTTEETLNVEQEKYFNKMRNNPAEIRQFYGAVHDSTSIAKLHRLYAKHRNAITKVWMLSFKRSGIINWRYRLHLIFKYELADGTIVTLNLPKLFVNQETKCIYPILGISINGRQIFSLEHSAHEEFTRQILLDSLKYPTCNTLENLQIASHLHFLDKIELISGQNGCNFAKLFEYGNFIRPEQQDYDESLHIYLKTDIYPWDSADIDEHVRDTKNNILKQFRETVAGLLAQ